MKVAVVRGPSLNPWEMQTYEKMSAEIEILGVGSKLGQYGLGKIGIPVKRLFCVGEYFGNIPGGVWFLYRYMGDTQVLLGFDRVVEGFDIVHVAELGSYYSLQAVRAKKKGLVKAVTLTVFENIPFLGDENVIRRKLKQEVRDGVDHFFAASKGAREALLLEGVDERKISILGPGVDTKRFSVGFRTRKEKLKKVRRKYGLGADDFVVLFVGRLVKEKGVYDIFKCAHKVQSSKFKTKKYSRIKFLFIGDGPEKSELEKYKESLGLGDAVSIMGGVSYDKMPQVFGMADVFLLASLETETWKEQYGMVLLEAMASGLPIVGTTSGAIPEVVGSGGGYFSLPVDWEDLARNLLELYKKPKERQKMGKVNRKKAVVRYDVRVVSRKITDTWRSIS